MGYSVACNKGIVTIRDDRDGECNTLEDVEHIIRAHANQHFINQITMVSLDGTSVPVAWDSGDLTVYATPDQLKPAKVSKSFPDRRYTIAGLAVLILAGYFFATPYLTIASIKSNLSERNAEALSENIDFPLLRQNLKDQFNLIAVQAGSSLEDLDFFSGLGVMVASQMIDSMLDGYITPHGLKTAFKEMEKMDQNKKAEFETTVQNKLFKEIRYSYESINKFSFWLQDDGEDIQCILQRDGLSWRLVNIVMPETVFNSQPN